MAVLTSDHVLNIQTLSLPAPEGSSAWVVSGELITDMQATTEGHVAHGKETYSVLIGPALAPGGRASAIVFPLHVVQQGDVSYIVSAIEADIDDESGRAQLTFELSGAIASETEAGTLPVPRTLAIKRVGFQLVIVGRAA